MNSHSWIRTAAIALLIICTTRADAIVVAHLNPKHPIGSIPSELPPADCSGEQPCRYFGVGKIYHNGSSCSGTPIGDRTILTAAHCFDSNDAGGAVNPGTTYFYIPGILGAFYGTPINHPNYTGAVVDNSDIAILHLDTALPPFIPRFRLSRFNGVPVGAVSTHVGYGCTGNGLSGVPLNCGTSSRLNVVRNVIDGLRTPNIFTIDHDGGGFNRMGGGALVRQELVKPGGVINVYDEGVTIFGDSGGPVFYNTFVDDDYREPIGFVKLQPDVFEVIGVCSFGTTPSGRPYGGYGTTSSYVFVGNHRTWIQSVSSDAVLADSVLNHPIEPAAAEISGVLSNDVPIDDGLVLDLDADLIGDYADNCSRQANFDQRDTDSDGFGNRCDVDLNNDGIVNSLDLGLFRARFMTTNPDADFNADGIVNSIDLGILRGLFGLAPGPGRVPAQ